MESAFCATKFMDKLWDFDVSLMYQYMNALDNMIHAEWNILLWTWSYIRTNCTSKLKVSCAVAVSHLVIKIAINSPAPLGFERTEAKVTGYTEMRNGRSTHLNCFLNVNLKGKNAIYLRTVCQVDIVHRQWNKQQISLKPLCIYWQR